ncbi:putative MATE family efflux protein [Elusimicrobium posterum]|uniref:MATE family efflux transporter n=1 Tax=Elusimicrobium posterum TaxID=3116653 RepID=UPI003C781E2A
MTSETLSGTTAPIINPFKGKSLQNLILKFSAPAIIGIIVNALYNVADRAFIGHSIGPDGISAITISFPMSLFIMACSIMVGVGGSVLFSINLGKRNTAKAEVVLSHSLSLVFLISSIIALTWSLTLDRTLVFLGASPEVLPYAKAYMHIILLGAPIQSIAMTMNNFLRAIGRPKTAMSTMIIGAIINCILGPLFIFVFNWGMEGAAWAVVISQSVSATWVMTHFIGKKKKYSITLKNLKLRWDITKETITIGSSQLFVNSAVTLVNIVINYSLVNHGGDIALAAMGVVTSVNTLLIMPVLGISQGVQPIVAYYYGAKYFKRMIQIVKLSMFWATAITTFAFIVIMIFAPQMVKVFNNESAELIKLASFALRVFNAMVPLVGFQVMVGMMLQATAQPKKAILLTLSRQVLILIPLILILPRFLGLNGIIVASPISDIMAFCLAAYMFRRELKKFSQA